MHQVPLSGKESYYQIKEIKRLQEKYCAFFGGYQS